MKNFFFDIVIVGGNIVGNTLANSLQEKKFSIAIVEKKIEKLFNDHDKPDIRVFAINNSSVNFLKKIQVWTKIKKMRSCPYRILKTWELKNFCVTFSSSSLGLSKMGYIIENNVLKSALLQNLKKNNVTLFCPEEVNNIQYYNIHNYIWKIILNKYTLYTKLIIGADGANSSIRKLAKIKTYYKKYNQDCMLISILCKYPTGETAWQNLTPNGPRAFLPMFNNWASLIWYDKSEKILELQKMSFLELKKEIKENFPKMLGRFKIKEIACFTLYKQHAKSYIKKGLVLVGDAAHTIHPLAGQGLNLGYRDIKTLTKILENARNENKQWNSLDILMEYQNKRYLDNIFMQNSINTFHHIFNNNCLSLKIIRNFGMFLVNQSSFIKKYILYYAVDF